MPEKWGFLHGDKTPGSRLWLLPRQEGLDDACWTNLPPGCRRYWWIACSWCYVLGALWGGAMTAASAR
jgi:hypothetical protein